MIVLDASALLAFLFDEPGGDRVAAFLEDGCMSSVNLSEVLGRFARDGHDVDEVVTHLAGTGLEQVPFTDSDAAVAASLVPATRPLGLSLGDRACLALARSRGLPVLTADRAWADLDLDLGLEIRMLRPQP